MIQAISSYDTKLINLEYASFRLINSVFKCEMFPVLSNVAHKNFFPPV